MHYIHYQRLPTAVSCRRSLSTTCRCLNKPTADSVAGSASARLFADAADEEGSSPATPGALSPSGSRTFQSARQEPNWDGDERVQDTVLRMLVDKYKPLRTHVIRTADEKLKADPALSGNIDAVINRGLSLDDLPPLQTPTMLNSGKRASARSSEVTDQDDPKARAESRRARKLEEGPRRLESAKEKSLDYRFVKILGDGAPDVGKQEGERPGNALTTSARRPNPVTVKGWTQLAEERIEARYSCKARAAGLFNAIEGRGKPIKREAEESNPFIAREEALMNRIIKRQGAAPPWVEIHGELEHHIRVFRGILSSSWVKRATREILLSLPASSRTQSLSANVTIERIASMRDPEWEQRESSYFNAALEEVNSQIRRMNGLAPFAARRGYLLLKYELERSYEASAPEIIRAIEERLRDDGAYSGGWNNVPREDLAGTVGTGDSSMGIWAAVKRLALKLVPGPARPTV
ncbi:hypothetical protein FRB96_000286 [Tulasnella sp. 330]|nr:hypothetical protein FRB96_000286 [Tulasnella sp. 330]KAG8882263.1 hypothetical protein FRB97_008466 [Tulasnella sp. 331]KAG8886874.1 hypothetical protein FRB98_000900 [Tulasnella sp. 332]